VQASHRRLPFNSYMTSRSKELVTESLSQDSSRHNWRKDKPSTNRTSVFQSVRPKFWIRISERERWHIGLEMEVQWNDNRFLTETPGGLDWDGHVAMMLLACTRCSWH